jgi:hypothetical protein
MTDAQIQAKIDSRIAEFHNDVCERVRLGEITDMEASELVAAFADRVYSQGAWS